MATDFQNSGMDLVRTAIGLTPLGFAAYHAFTQPSNERVIPSIGKSNPVHSLGKELGQAARNVLDKTSHSKSVSAESARRALQNKLANMDSIRELLNDAQSRNSLVQSLALVLDEPSLGIEDSARIKLKQQLLQIAETGGANHEKIVADVLQTLSTTASDDVMSLFARTQTQFKDLADQLGVVRNPLPRRGVAFTQIPGAHLSSQEKDYINSIQKALGKNYLVQPASYQEFGETVRQARVYRTTMLGNRFQTAIPLSTSSYYRAGEAGRTLYQMPRAMIDLSRAANLLDRKATEEQIARLNISPGSYFGKELMRRASQGSVNFNEFNAWMRSYMTNVDRLSSTNHLFGAHARLQSSKSMNVVGLYNIEQLSPSQQTDTIAKLGTLRYFDPGVGHKRLLSRSDTGITGTLGIHKGSLLERLQEIYGWQDSGGNVINRETVPLTMREHQLVGRTGLFWGPSNPIGSSGLVSGSILGAAHKMNSKGPGGLIKALRTVSPYGELVSGGLGSPVLIDVSGKGKLSVGAGGSGMAFTGTKRQLATPIQFSILDPASHGYLGSDILQKLQAAGDQGINLTKEELRKGLYLGETGTGSKILPWDERTQEMHLRLAEVTEGGIGSSTKRSISVTGYIRKEAEMFKTFGLLHKGNIEVVDNLLSVFNTEQVPALQGALQQSGINPNEAIAASSDMLSKGAVGFMHQLAGGSRLVSQGKITPDMLRSRAQQVSRSPVLLPHAGGTYTALAHYAQAAMELMHKEGVNASHIGVVMAGVFSGAEGSSTKYGLDKNSIMSLAKNLFHDSASFNAFSKAVQAGVTIGYDVFALGESVNDWGRARAGVEPRFAKALHERLLGYGLDIDSASKVVAGIYKNKIGLGPHYQLASQLLDMTRYTSGQTTPATFAMHSAKKRMTYNELLKNIAQNDEHSLTNLLKNTPGGLILDLTSGPGLLANASKDIFGQGELFLPGKEAFEAAKGTAIKRTEGAALEVDSYLGQLTKSLQQRLIDLPQNGQQARESLGAWKQESDKLFIQVIDQLHSGKIKGSISPTAALYDLTHGTNFGTNTKALARARKVFFHTKGTAVFQSAEGFASQLADSAGTSRKELSWRARQFFTAMEHNNSKRWTGIMGLGGRHPMLSTGNVYMTQTFRHIKEIQGIGGEDVFFEKLLRSDIGQDMLGKFRGAKPTSFRDIAKRPLREQRVFFDSLVDNISKFTSGRSADVLFVPTLKTSAGDLGIGTQAFLDMDGDHAVHFFFKRDVGKKVVGQLTNNGNALALQDFKTRAFANAMVGQTKAALDTLKSKLMAENGAMSLNDRVWNDVMKEVGTSMSTGGLDTALRPLHEAFLMYEPDPQQKAYARLFLGSIQESFVIKGKKLPVATDYPEQIKLAARHLTQTGNADQLRTLLYDIFGQEDLAKGGMQLQGQVQLDSSAGPELRKQFDKMFGTFEGKLSENYHLEDFLSRVERFMGRAISEGTQVGLSGGQLSALLESNPSQAFTTLEGSSSMVAGSLEGFFGKKLSAKVSSIAGQFRESIQVLDRMHTNKLALGVAASALAVSLLRDQTTPQILESPNEYIAPGLLSRLKEGNIFKQADSQIEPESLQQNNNDYSMPPINANNMYINKPNSYQIRGQINTADGIANYSSYFSQLSGNGRGVVTINDRRRPITSNYVDRLLGEY